LKKTKEFGITSFSHMKLWVFKKKQKLKKPKEFGITSLHMKLWVLKKLKLKKKKEFGINF